MLRSSGGRPLADQIYATLRRRIDEGAWTVEDRLPSERALAEELGVCRVTVARAVNRLVTEGVLSRRRGSGTYISETNAVSLAPRPVTGSVALVIPFGRDTFAGNIVKGVAATLSDGGYHVLFHDTHADWRREAHQIQRLRGRVDGFLVFPTDPTRNHDVYSAVLADGVPLVFVDRYFPALYSDWVVTDNYNASLEAVRRLVRDNRRRVVHITTSEMHCTSTLDRRLGYCQALLEAGLPVRSEDIRILTQHPAPTAAGGAPEEYAAGVPDAPHLNIQPIIQSLVRGDEPADALFAVNDWTTLACLHALNHERIRVPEDVAVAGFVDNDLVLANLPVPILAVSQPAVEMGRQAAQTLIDRLRGAEDAPRQRFLPAAVREAGGAWAWSRGERA